MNKENLFILHLTQNKYFSVSHKVINKMEGFFFILAEDGKVLFVSENVEKFIGFSQV